ncbi:MAG: hypothetical protein K2P67_12510 [Gallionellaceae bacterium]|jgi:hypothetical protein|nr:hypothetical protein [Gallionellaceae bacterium]
MNTPGDSDQKEITPPNDRRANLRLRAIFDDACRITASFFDPAQSWNGMHLTLYARKALHEAYPDLTQQDLALLFSAVQRFHMERNLAACHS